MHPQKPIKNRLVYIQYILYACLSMTRIKALSSKHLVYKINENDHRPPHVHVEGMGASVRINLLTLEVMDAETDFSTSTLNRILRVIKENKMLLLERWEELHG